jgi:thiol-disulfide isomerase/thioredoxin
MLMTRRSSVALVALLAIAFAGSAAAESAAPQPFTQAAFDAARQADKPILVDVYATWCDVCARQKPILDKLRDDPRYKELVVFKVDFDTQKSAMRALNARVQSTLICFKGTKEVGRSVGETQPEWIDDLLSKTLVKGTS